MTMRYARFFFVLTTIGSTAASATDARVYDIHPPERGSQRAPNAAIQAKVDAFQQAIGANGMVDIKWNEVANQLFLISFTPPLPQVSSGDAVARARAFVEGNPDLFGLSASVVEAMAPTIEAREPQRSVVLLEQSFDGIPFFDQQGFLRVSMTDNAIAAVSGRYAINAPPLAAKPPLTVSAAYAQMRQQLPSLWKTQSGQPSPHDGQSGTVTFEPDPRGAVDKREDNAARQRTLLKHVGMDFTDELTARLTYFLDGAQARLTWEFNMNGTQARFAPEPNTLGIAVMDVLIDAQDGRVLFAHVDAGYQPHGIAYTTTGSTK